MANWTIADHVPSEVKEALLAARDADYKVKDLAEAAGITPNKMTRVGLGERDLTAVEYVKLQRALALTEPWASATPKYPSEPTLAAMLRFFLDREKAGRAPEDVLLDYALVLRSVLLSIQAGELVETDETAILERMNHLATAYDRRRQITSGS